MFQGFLSIQQKSIWTLYGSCVYETYMVLKLPFWTLTNPVPIHCYYTEESGQDIFRKICIYVVSKSFFWQTITPGSAHFSISSSLKAHSFLSISSIILLLLSIWERSSSGGRVVSHALFILALSIISTSASPAGSPQPGKQPQEHSLLYKYNYNNISTHDNEH